MKNYVAVTSLLGLLGAFISSGCGNQATPTESKQQMPDIAKFELHADESGVFGHWQRIEKKPTHGVAKFITIDERVILHTTRCLKANTKLYATSRAKIDFIEDKVIVIKSNDYVETIDREQRLLCQSNIRKGKYHVTQPNDDQLLIRQEGLKAMHFQRVSRESIKSK